MEHDIAHLIRQYQGKSFQELLDSPNLERDLKIIGQSIEEQDLNAQEAKAFLKQTVGIIEQAISDTQVAMAEEKNKIDHVQKMANACVAYLKGN